MPSVQVVLGGITFQDFEVPESINFGGSQRLVVHKLVGGGRTVGAIGSDPDDISWAGRFRGAQALQRAQQLDRMRQLGSPITLTWGGLTYIVIIAQATFDYQRSFEIPYRITCTVAQPELPPQTTTVGANAAVNGNLSSIGSFIANAKAAVTSTFAALAGPLAGVQSLVSQASQAVGAIGGVAGLSTSALSGVLTPLNSANTAINGAIQIGDGNIFTGASQIGGVIPGSPTGGASLLTGQIAGLQTLSGLITARGSVGQTIMTVTNAPATSADTAAPVALSGSYVSVNADGFTVNEFGPPDYSGFDAIQVNQVGGVYHPGGLSAAELAELSEPGARLN